MESSIQMGKEAEGERCSKKACISVYTGENTEHVVYETITSWSWRKQHIELTCGAGTGTRETNSLQSLLLSVREDISPHRPTPKGCIYRSMPGWQETYLRGPGPFPGECYGRRKAGSRLWKAILSAREWGRQKISWVRRISTVKESA